MLVQALAASKQNVSALSEELAAAQDNNATLLENLADAQENLTACSVKLEQRRLVRLAEAAEDFFANSFNDAATDAATPPLDGSGRNISSGGSGRGRTTAGILVPVVVVGALLAAYLRKKRAKNAETKQRNAAEVNALRDRGATLEMVPNPMWEQPPNGNGGGGGGGVSGATAAGAADDAAPSEVYYSEIADGPQLDADGYVVDGSTTSAPPEPVVYATYASSSEVSTAGLYAEPNDAQMHAASADAAPEAGPRTYSTPVVAASAAAMYAVPPERGGIAYASSAPAAFAGYENSSMLAGDRSDSVQTGTQHDGSTESGGADARSSHA